MLILTCSMNVFMIQNFLHLSVYETGHANPYNAMKNSASFKFLIYEQNQNNRNNVILLKIGCAFSGSQ